MIRSTLLALATALISTSSAAQIFGDLGQPAWSRLYKYLNERAGKPSADTRILVLPVAPDAAWDDRIRPLRFMEMNKWGDWSPSDSWQYFPISGKRISDGYSYFLKAAFTSTVARSGAISDERKRALLRADEELTFTRDHYNSTVRNADQAYEDYSRRTSWPSRLSKDRWLESQGYDKQIAATKSAFDDAANTYEVIVSGVKDPDLELLKTAQLRFQDPSQRRSLPATRDVLNEPDRWQQYYVSLIDGDIDAFLRESKPQHDSLEEAYSRSDYFEKRWSASVSVSFLGLFRAGGASAEQIQREQHIRKNVTRIDMSFDNLALFNIQRGAWYDENAISRFGGKLSQEMYDAVFGANGQLQLIPQSVLVARGMRFTVCGDSQSMDYLYEHFGAGADAGLNIGWWRIGGGADYSTTREETEIKRIDNCIDFRDLSGRGSVLAVLAKEYGQSIARPASTRVNALNDVKVDLTASSKRIKDLSTQSSPERTLKGKVPAATLDDFMKASKPAR